METQAFKKAKEMLKKCKLENSHFIVIIFELVVLS
jgi:hypothetical protein